MGKDRFFSDEGQSEIDALQTITEVATGITGIHAYKCGKVVTLYITPSSVITAQAAGWISLGTLPDALKPDSKITGFQMRFAGFDNQVNSWSNSNVVPMALNPGGTVSWYAFPDHLTCIPHGSITYFSAT